ncbi:uncharacterized protein LACBIDRAFT_330278 [Laccaria bicolor S238N-H82]|uniref:Predicted protein n=1 Tax=Laccaria bicolor (strain S238N-H82 / ATCC MYA-4686) TaxID=486041 RepID=B0DKS4_LACBS|nr:uncharacterized protein LACBIDRAFT_330278 [Laccaria bicolor S238N-H82]EDR04696.1 predicted protein [Laccaria bicolor S238N-H82]|eukprot:XP_001884520.1 predicted protein [Laccaria bicolor S238N-H82]
MRVLGSALSLAPLKVPHHIFDLTENPRIIAISSQDDPLANSDSDTETAGPSTQALPSTPRRRRQSAPPASSPISVMNPTPVRRGHPTKKACKSGPATEPRLSAADLEQQQQLCQEQQEQRKREMEAEKQHMCEQARQLREETKEQEKTSA